jgi:hypothetical protein
MTAEFTTVIHFILSVKQSVNIKSLVILTGSPEFKHKSSTMLIPKPTFGHSWDLALTLTPY